MQILIPSKRNLYLMTDDDNWIVAKKGKGRRNGNETFFDHRYFSTLASALRYLSDHVLKDCSDLKEIRLKQVEFSEWVKSELEFTGEQYRP